ncbi:unnamed protein product, partial [Hymenolepis diminuta]
QKKLSSEQLYVTIDENPTCTTRELSKFFNVSRHMAICKEMKRFDKVSKTGKWIPHGKWELLEINEQQCVTCCVSLCSHKLQAPILGGILTDSDEKWILYNNIKCKRQWLCRGSCQFLNREVDCTRKNSFVCMVRFKGNCLL